MVELALRDGVVLVIVTTATIQREPEPSEPCGFDAIDHRLHSPLFRNDPPLAIQSMIAIGSGGFLGKGFLKGSQTQLKFLPEQQTDFVFSVFAEEWGFVGGLVLMLMFLSLIIWGLKIALHSKDLLGTILAFGITALIAWQVLINMGMVLGMMPVVGIPLPFLSYGGSAIVTLLGAIGLLMNVSVRRFILQR